MRVALRLMIRDFMHIFRCSLLRCSALPLLFRSSNGSATMLQADMSHRARLGIMALRMQASYVPQAGYAV